MSVWEQIHELVDNYDADFECGVASESMWSGQLRVTLTNPEDRPSRSMTFYSTGGSDPEDVAIAVLADFHAWREETGEEPLPVPEYLKE
jgi:hypothetical protein